MKYFIIILLCLHLFSCTDAKYSKLDVVCAYDKKLTIINVYEYKGTGADLKGTNYKCRYVNELGKIETIHIYEKEIIPCK